MGHEGRPMAARRGRRGPCKASYGGGSRSRWTRAGEESPSPVVGWGVSPVRVCVGRGAGWCGCGGMGEWGGGGTGSGARDGTTKAWLGSPRHGSEDMCATLNNYKKNPRGATPFFFQMGPLQLLGTTVTKEGSTGGWTGHGRPRVDPAMFGHLGRFWTAGKAGQK